MQLKQERTAKSEDSLVKDTVVFQDEKEELNRRRAARNPQRDPVALANGSEQRDQSYSGCLDTVGLALSGGGIRSAAFCTGAMQALTKNKIFGQIDYISSVSGGGYSSIASTLSMAETSQFPFFDSDEKKDTPAMRVLRDNANYLKSGKKFEMLKNFAIYLRGIAANILLVGAWIIFAAGVTLLCNPSYEDMNKSDLVKHYLGWEWGAFSLSILLLVILVLSFVGWALATFDFRKSGINSLKVPAAALLLMAGLLVLLIELQPYVVLKMIGNAPAVDSAGATDQSGEGGGKLVKQLIGVLSAVSVVLTGLSTVLGNVFKQDEKKGGIVGVVKSFFESRILWWVAAAIFPLLLWLVYLLLVYWGMTFDGAPEKLKLPERSVTVGLTDLIARLPFGFHRIPLFYFTLGLILILASLFLTANENSPHRLYRDRLGQAFCFILQPAKKGSEGIAKPVLDRKLSELVEKDNDKPPKLGPYHLINTALNIAGDKKVNMRGRNADFFLFSPLFVGSRSTGYARTGDVENLARAKCLDVATAMAISGAAFSSNMGSATLKLLRFTLAFFNVRLGYWFPHPKQVQGSVLKPMYYYFVKEVLGLVDSESDMIYLTDGGHIENLGLYELLRRRCQVIIVVDAEADREMTFPGFVTVQRYARIDLGIRIDLSWSKLAATSLAAQNGGVAPAQGPHVSIGRICYEGKGEGVLIYVKSSVTGDENDYVRDYNRRYKDFPHQTTGDQFFSEEQFEVYRSLAFHAVDRVFQGQDAVETKSGKLAYLLDSACQDECVQEAVKRLGMTLKTYDSPPVEPTIHQVRLLPESGQGLPLQVTMIAPPKRRSARKVK